MSSFFSDADGSNSFTHLSPAGGVFGTAGVVEVLLIRGMPITLGRVAVSSLTSWAAAESAADDPIKRVSINRLTRFVSIGIVFGPPERVL